MAPQGITGRQPASQPLVVVELDMTVDPRGLCGAESCLCDLESDWIAMGRTKLHGADFETD